MVVTWWTVAFSRSVTYRANENNMHSFRKLLRLFTIVIFPADLDLLTNCCDKTMNPQQVSP